MNGLELEGESTDEERYGCHDGSYREANKRIWWADGSCELDLLDDTSPFEVNVMSLLAGEGLLCCRYWWDDTSLEAD